MVQLAIYGGHSGRAARLASAGFADSEWIAALDVQFAILYFAGVRAALSGQPSPGSWQALFGSRNTASIGRIQFALAGMNAHINHDLPEAIVATCQLTATVPEHAGVHYSDYIALNSTLNGLIESAKRTLHVRLLGDPLPPVSHLETTIAAWSVSAAREAAWDNSELMWHLRDSPPLSANFTNTLDGLTTVIAKALLSPVP